MIKKVIKWFDEYIMGNGVLKNKQGKTVFELYDGETTWYLGDSAEQVKKWHISNSGQEEDEIEYIKPMLIKEARGQFIIDIDDRTKESFIKAIDYDFKEEIVCLACTVC
jgi:hypothetical protein